MIDQILNNAAGLVRQGWWQAGKVDSNTPLGVCASIAIGRAAGVCTGEYLGEVPSVRDAHTALLRVLGVEDTTRWTPIYMWNDAPGQTAENVAATLELAAIYWLGTQQGALPTMRVNGQVVTEQELLAEVSHA